MYSDITNNQDRNSLMFIMASISPKVAESLELELYRSTADSDGATEEYILEDCFQRLLRDLDAIGLAFDIDMSDYVEDMSKLSSFVQLAQLLLPNTLYGLIKTDTPIRELLEQIMRGSLGDGETVIQTYLSELAGLDGNLPLRPTMVDFIDQIYPLISQTDIFTDYLANLLDLHQQERPSVIVDDVRHSDYRTFLRERIGRLSDAINAFSQDINYPQLCHIQNHLIRDLIVPDNFVAYAYLFLEKKEDLPVELQEGYDQKWYHYRVSHPWCAEYYQIRNLPITAPYQIMIACFTYALSSTYEGYTRRISAFRATNPDIATDEKIASLFAE